MQHSATMLAGRVHYSACDSLLRSFDDFRSVQTGFLDACYARLGLPVHKVNRERLSEVETAEQSIKALWSDIQDSGLQDAVPLQAIREYIGRMWGVNYGQSARTLIFKQ